ncbi:MAG: hypothetical protein IT521_10050 [Burkholderiales bacterium]|nr:hypothetical protein [Burkholderiales bacterium]
MLNTARSRPKIVVAVIAALVALAAAAQSPLTVQRFECLGEEPSWRLDVSGVTATYTTLGAKGKRVVVFRGSLQAMSFLTPAVYVWRGDTTQLPRETLVVSLREEACRSTMADTPPLTHRAILSLKAGEALTGCCTLRMRTSPPGGSATGAR